MAGQLLALQAVMKECLGFVACSLWLSKVARKATLELLGWAGTALCSHDCRLSFLSRDLQMQLDLFLAPEKR